MADGMTEPSAGAGGTAVDAGRVVIVVPMAPPRELLPNMRRRGRGGAHWSEQHEATVAFRTAAKGAALNALSELARDLAGIPIIGPVIVTYDVVWPWTRYKEKGSIPDVDAIPSAAKAALDGIVDAGILADDGDGHVVEIRARGRRGRKGEEGATVVILDAA